MLQSPEILSPITNWVPNYNNYYYTSNPTQKILGTVVVPADLPAGRILTVAYSYSIRRGNSDTPFTSYTMAGIIAGATTPEETDVAWSYNSDTYIELLEGDRLTLRFKALEFTNLVSEVGYQTDESDPVDIIAYVVNINKIDASTSIPTGLQLKLYKDYMKIIVSESLEINENSTFLGCNFYISLDPGGGTGGYQLINDTYINTYDESETVTTTVVQSDVTSEAGDIITETKKSKRVYEKYYSFKVDKAVLNKLVSDGKIRDVFLSDNETINEDVTFYYITTFLVYDKTLNTLVESFQSYELEGKFLKYSTDFKGLPTRRRQDILFSMVKRLNANNSLVNVVTGQVIRDVIDPVTDMFEKFYTIQDFVFKCESVDSLIAFDDANGDGVSDPVSTSILKSNLKDALGVTDDVALQELINEQFDRQAANFNMERKVATRSKGTVIFYTTKRPLVDILISNGTYLLYPGDINLNIPSINFKVVGNYIFEAATVDNYYNASKQRYELEANITSENYGSVNNIPAGTITLVSGLDPSIQVENLAPTDYGSDSESNQDLASRVKVARPSFDSGTKPGYTSTASNVPGVFEVNVQEAGDPLMVRDYDEASKSHVGGKVDVYIRGNNISQVVDQLAFKFEHPTDALGNQVGEVFNVIDANDFRIKSSNPKVTSDSPIVSVNKIRNITKGKNYDLSDLEIMDDTLILNSSNQINLDIGMAAFDVVEVDYVYRSSNILVLQNQPVIEIAINGVLDKDGNIIDSSNYRLVKNSDPLKKGNSYIAGSGIEFLFDSDISGPHKVPDIITIEGEQHSIRSNQPAKINFKGVVLNSIVVRSSTDTSIVYKKGIDYNVSFGNQTDYSYITLVRNGMIRSGDVILVDYEASPNLFITYTYNSLVPQVQSKIDTMKHACADTIAKEAVENFIDLSFNVERDLSIAVSSTGAITDDEKRLRSRIQTAIYNAVAGLKMGATLTQSYLLKTVLSVSGVKSVSTPFTMMMKRSDSFIPLDDVGHVSFEIFQKAGSSGSVSYRTIDPVLTYSTSENGGPDNMFRAVYEDMQELELVSEASLVSKARGRAYIQSDGRIIVSTKDGKPPQSKYYNVAYYVSYPVGTTYVEDIAACPIEYLNVDSLSFKGIDFIN